MIVIKPHDCPAGQHEVFCMYNCIGLSAWFKKENISFGNNICEKNTTSFFDFWLAQVCIIL